MIAANGPRLGAGGAFTTTFHTKPNTSNLRKTVNRSISPPLAPSRCYGLAFVVRFIFNIANKPSFKILFQNEIPAQTRNNLAICFLTRQMIQER